MCHKPLLVPVNNNRTGLQKPNENYFFLKVMIFTKSRKATDYNFKLGHETLEIVMNINISV